MAIKNRPLICTKDGKTDNRPHVKIRVAGAVNDSFDDKPEVEAILDTGFQGHVILPMKALKEIDPALCSPVPIQQCPRYRGYGDKKGKPNPHTYRHLGLRVECDDGAYKEIIPDFVSFGEREFGLIGMDLLIGHDCIIEVDGAKETFSVTSPHCA